MNHQAVLGSPSRSRPPAFLPAAASNAADRRGEGPRAPRKMLTVDTHCDTAFSLLRTDWKIGDRHDPARAAPARSTCPG